MSVCLSIQMCVNSGGSLSHDGRELGYHWKALRPITNCRCVNSTFLWFLFVSNCFYASRWISRKVHMQTRNYINCLYRSFFTKKKKWKFKVIFPYGGQKPNWAVSNNGTFGHMLTHTQTHVYTVHETPINLWSLHVIVSNMDRVWTLTRHHFRNGLVVWFSNRLQFHLKRVDFLIFDWTDGKMRIDFFLVISVRKTWQI